MKNIIKIICIFVLIYLSINYSWAGVVSIDDGTLEAVKKASIEVQDNSNSDNLWTSIISFWETLLWSVKIILSTVIILFLVYAWANMVLAFWSDEDKISSSKRQVWYSIIWLVFINIPWTLYDAFQSDGGEINQDQLREDQFRSEQLWGNLFFDSGVFENLILDRIVVFMEVIIFWMAVFVLILAWYQILTARGRDEKISEARSKIIYSIVWLFFVGFIAGIKRVVYTWENAAGVDIFSAISNLVLLFAAPTAVVFLILAAYYYITSNGDDEKVKKAKTIVINTFLATLLLLALYTFLLDLATI
jgi:hypothetical protein